MRHVWIAAAAVAVGVAPFAMHVPLPAAAVTLLGIPLPAPASACALPQDPAPPAPPAPAPQDPAPPAPKDPAPPAPKDPAPPAPKDPAPPAPKDPAPPAPKDPAPPAPPTAPPAPQAARKPPKDPSRPVAEKIQESLKTILTGSGSTRISSQAALDAAVAEWAAEAKEDPLRAVKWWRTALQGTLTTAVPRAGIEEKKVPGIEGKDGRLWVSVPKGYSAKNSYPLLLVVLDKDEEPKRAIPAHYGDLLKEWIVVAISAEPKIAGFDIQREPFLLALGLRHAAETYRVDRDRVVLDSGPGNANLVCFLGSEWAVHFAGVVLRGPSDTSPLATNLALCATLAVPPESPTPPQARTLVNLKAAAPEISVLADPKTRGEAIQKWIAAVPPRRISNPDTLTFAWKARPQNGEPWAYWFWVFRASEARQNRLVTLTFTRSAEGGAVDIVGDNLAEGILLLNDDLLDLDRPVTVRFGGKEVWKGTAQRKITTALNWIGQTGERTLFTPAEIRFTVPANPVVK